MIVDLRTAIEHVVGNARRRGIDAFHASVALSLVAPVEGRAWHALCCWCLERLEHDAPDEFVHRISKLTWQDAGGCSRCPYSGPDTLVVALASGR